MSEALVKAESNGDPNGIRTHFERFAYLRNSATNLRQPAYYYIEREIGPLADSRRFTQFPCPNLSEIETALLRARTRVEFLVKLYKKEGAAFAAPPLILLTFDFLRKV